MLPMPELPKASPQPCALCGAVDHMHSLHPTWGLLCHKCAFMWQTMQDGDIPAGYSSVLRDMARVLATTENALFISCAATVAANICDDAISTAPTARRIQRRVK